MSISRQLGKRQGFIIVITLVLMLVMTTMGVGLYYSTKQTAQQVGVNVNRSETFYAAESCITEAKHWLQKKSVSGAPCINKSIGSTCHSISSTKMSKWKLSGENQMFKNRTEGQRYKCSVSLLGKVTYEGGEGVGFDIGESETYGNVLTNTKYMYRINSKGFVGNLSSEVEEVVSMIF
jgi:Tfp pilus assembly protein PilX